MMTPLMQNIVYSKQESLVAVGPSYRCHFLTVTVATRTWFILPNGICEINDIMEIRTQFLILQLTWGLFLQRVNPR